MLFAPEAIATPITGLICFDAKSSIRDGTHTAYNEFIILGRATSVLEGRIDRSTISYKLSSRRTQYK